MTITTQDAARQAGKLATGADIKTAKAGAKLRFGGGLYLLVSGTGTKSWQVHYHVGGKHQATIIGRWPDLGIVEAKAKREEFRRTIREGGDPAHDRHEARTARRDGDAATVRIIGETWLDRAEDARAWSPRYAVSVRALMRNHVWPVIGERPIGRVTLHEIEALIGDLWKRLRAQAVHVRQHLTLLFDFAMRRDLLAVNPVRKIAEDLPRRRTGAEANYARVTTIEDARAVLRAVEASGGTAFGKLAHRLIALTAVRKREGLEARWSEVAETADGMVWTVPASRMKGKTGHRRAHVIPLAPQAADVFRAARALQAATGNVSEHVFPGQRRDGPIEHAAPCRLLNGALTRIGMEGRHTIHGWRGTFSTILNEADPGAGRVIDVMLAHKTFGEVEGRYNKASFVAQRRGLASTWADQLLDGAPSAHALVGLVEADTSNVVELRRAA